MTLSGDQSADGVLTVDGLKVTAAQLALSGSAVIGAGGLPEVLDFTGQIAAADGAPVLLPVAGSETFVDRADLAVRFDAAEGERWAAEISVERFVQGGISVDGIDLTGGGTIVTAGGPEVTADLDLEARNLDLGDPDAQAALGETVTAGARIVWDGGPLVLEALDVTGESYALSGSALVGTGEGQVDLSGQFDVAAEDLAVFSGLAGRPLSGRLEAALTGEAAPVAGVFSAVLAGEGQDLSVGIAEVDRILAGASTLDVAVRRDETGTFLDRLEVGSDEAAVSARAEIASDGGIVDATVTLRDASVLSAELSGPVVLEADAEGAGTDWTLEARVDGAGLAVLAALEADLAGDVPLFSGDTTVRAEALEPFAGLVGRDLAGSFSLSGSGTAAADLSSFDLRLSGEALDLATGVAPLDALLEGRTQVGVSALGDGRSVTLRNLRAEVPTALVTGSGTVGFDRAADLEIEAVFRQPGLFAPGLPGPLTVAADVTGGPDVLSVVANAEAPGTVVGGTAEVDLTGPVPEMSGSVRVEVPDLAPFSELAGREVAGAVDLEADGAGLADLSGFDVEVRGRLTDLALGIAQADALFGGVTEVDVALAREGETVRAERLTLQNPALRVSGGGALSRGEATRAEVVIELLTPDLIAPGLPGPVIVSADVAGGPDTWDVTARIDGPGTDGGADLMVDLSGAVPRAEGRVSVDARDLSPFSELAGRTLGGAVDVSAEGSFLADATAFDLAVSGGLTDLAIGIAQVDALMAGETRLDVMARRDGDAIRAERLSLANLALRVTGDGTLSPDGRGSAEAEIVLVQPGLVAPGLPGPVTLAATAEGGPETWALKASVDGPATTGEAGADLDLTGDVPAASGAAEIAISDLHALFVSGRAGDRWRAGTGRGRGCGRGPERVRVSGDRGRVGAADRDCGGGPSSGRIGGCAGPGVPGRRGRAGAGDPGDHTRDLAEGRGRHGGRGECRRFRVPAGKPRASGGGPAGTGDGARPGGTGRWRRLDGGCVGRGSGRDRGGGRRDGSTGFCDRGASGRRRGAVGGGRSVPEAPGAGWDGAVRSGDQRGAGARCGIGAGDHERWPVRRPGIGPCPDEYPDAAWVERRARDD